jgi:serine/threonine-protein kinase
MEITSRLSTALAGRYQIERRLGEGGMATVYLAEDLKHKRKVALKVLRPELAAVLGAERFVQEITTTANLQHPHILPLFDSGEADSFLYYVMPYIEGETLRDKLDRETQLSVDEAVRITTELADALDYAHRHNVIHRDIKPENILLHDGRPTLADFGIALAVSAAAGGRMTETGLSLGTPHYMSPEQATAEKDLTNRSDIYSLGSVLYEMLTGEPPHVGGSAQAIIMKIVTDDARPVTELRKSVPAHVAAATAKSLERLAADRFESAAKFAEALTNTSFVGATTATPLMEAAADSRWKQRLAVPFAGLAGVFLALALWGWLRQTDTEAPVIRYVIAFDQQEALQSVFGPSLTLSPDGSLMAYVGVSERGRQLWVRGRNELSGTPIAGTDGVFQPFFSPDGRRVAFTTGERALKVVSLTGEPPLTLADSGLWRIGGSWGSDGYLYVGFQEYGTVVARIPAEGGPTEQISSLDTLRGEMGHSWFHALPGGKGVLFTAERLTNQASEQDAVAVVDLRTGEHRDLVQGVLGRYIDGYLVFVRYDGSLLAAPFDEERLEVTGPAVPLLSGMPVESGPDVALSRSGRLMYAPAASALGLAEVVWVDRQGVTAPYDSGWTVGPGPGGGPVLSPDGTRVAMSLALTGLGDIHIKEGPGGPLARLTFDGNSIRPVWSPDGQSIMYRSSQPGLSYDLFVKRADGTGPAEVLLDPEEEISQGLWSSDGRWVLAAAVGDIYAIRTGVDSTWTPLLSESFTETSPQLSPNGRWLAYVSDESGRNEIYVRSFPDVSDTKRQVSTDGGLEPRWAHSGGELFYKSPARELVVIDVDAGETFTIRNRRTLFTFDAAFGNPDPYPSYDVTPDDQRFLTFRSAGVNAGVIEVIVVENFLEELRTKVGN